MRRACRGLTRGVETSSILPAALHKPHELVHARNLPNLTRRLGDKRMRKIVVLPVVLVLGLVTSSALQASSAITDETTLHIIVNNARLHLVDVDGKGLTPGDMLVGHGPMFNRTETRRLGPSSVHCVFVGTHRPAHCTGDLVFSGGDITTQGVLTQPQFVWAVTGGTGTYENVRGQMQGSVLSDGDVELLFHLIP